jgi:hypothetical protein
MMVENGEKPGFQAENGTLASIDPLRLTPTELSRLTNIARMQWARWLAVGLPANLDSTYSLPAVIDWLRRHPRQARPRKYHGQPAAIGKRIGQRVAAMIESELAAFENSRHIREGAGFADGEGTNES